MYAGIWELRIFPSDSLVERVDAFNGTQARQLLAALDSVGLEFVALRLDPDPRQPVTECFLGRSFWPRKRDLQDAPPEPQDKAR